jgi:hypothetical protein
MTTKVTIKKSKRNGTTITFKGSAANRIFAQLSADIGGKDATQNMVPGTELHRMTTEEIAKKSSEKSPCG